MSCEIVNTAPRRTADVTAVQFAAVRGRLAFGFNRTTCADDALMAAWNKHIPLSPRTMVRMLTRNLPRDTQAGFSQFHESGRGELEVWRWNHGGYDLLMNDSRTFDLPAGTVLQGNVTVAPHLQGRGYGRTLLRNQIEFFHACGMKDFNITAGSDNGGYSWARMGFLPVKTGESLFHKGVVRHVSGRLELLAPVLPEDTVREVQELLQFNDPRDMWRLADMTVDVRPGLTAVFERATSAAAVDDIHRQRLRLLFAEAAESAAKRDASLGLGRLLLTGAVWHGQLDMRNRDQLTRMGRYCGGWQFLSL